MVEPATRPVLRLCASYEFLLREDCVVPARCQERHCAVCRRPVHYDPEASIPWLGQELIICDRVECLQATGLVG